MKVCGWRCLMEAAACFSALSLIRMNPSLLLLTRRTSTNSYYDLVDTLPYSSIGSRKKQRA